VQGHGGRAGREVRVDMADPLVLQSRGDPSGLREVLDMARPESEPGDQVADGGRVAKRMTPGDRDVRPNQLWHRRPGGSRHVLDPRAKPVEVCMGLAIDRRSKRVDPDLDSLPLELEQLRQDERLAEPREHLEHVRNGTGAHAAEPPAP
jgi:hypothetical protein